jgi:hypothetical protein
MKFRYFIFLLLNALLKIVSTNTDMQKVRTLLFNQQTADTSNTGRVKQVDLGSTNILGEHLQLSK